MSHDRKVLLNELNDALRKKAELKRRFIEKPLSPTEEEKSDMNLFEIMVNGVKHAGVRAYLQTHFLSALRMRLEDKVSDDPILKKDLEEQRKYRWKQVIRMASNIRELEAVGIL